VRVCGYFLMSVVICEQSFGEHCSTGPQEPKRDWAWLELRVCVPVVWIRLGHMVINS
jgi:hypothetical protein